MSEVEKTLPQMLAKPITLEIAGGEREIYPLTLADVAEVEQKIRAMRRAAVIEAARELGTNTAEAMTEVKKATTDRVTPQEIDAWTTSLKGMSWIAYTVLSKGDETITPDWIDANLDTEDLVLILSNAVSKKRATDDRKKKRAVTKGASGGKPSPPLPGPTDSDRTTSED